MQDFDSFLSEVCESVMSELLDASCKDSTAWKLAKFGVGLSDCPRRPQEFDDALVELFQPMGALLIEDRILARFYRRLGTKYPRGNDLGFADEVKKARRLFEETREST